MYEVLNDCFAFYVYGLSNAHFTLIRWHLPRFCIKLKTFYHKTLTQNPTFLHFYAHYAPYAHFTLTLRSLMKELTLTSFLHKIEEIIEEFFSLGVVIQLVQLKKNEENVKPYNDKKRHFLTIRGVLSLFVIKENIPPDCT